MAFDAALADKIRKRLHRQAGLTEKTMFGGIGFLLDGNLCCGVLGKEMIVRMNPSDADLALKKPHTRVFDFSGRPMKGWIFVDPKGLATEARLHAWVDLSVKFAKSLPAKK